MSPAYQQMINPAFAPTASKLANSMQQRLPPQNKKQYSTPSAIHHLSQKVTTKKNQRATIASRISLRSNPVSVISETKLIAMIFYFDRLLFDAAT
jgi:hypothetical protein